jgi:pyrimidine-specific ribonucleoside hydrolase
MRAVLDMDPGHDDALALLTAFSLLEVAGVTTVAGNQTLDKTTLNALRVVRAAGRSTAVVPGCSHPWLVPLVTAPHVHGDSGLDGYDLPPMPLPETAENRAMAFLRTLFAAADSVSGLHWIATGPLTNVASFLSGHPDLRHRIASLTIMGGSLGHGNITADAEFNIYVDPEAAQYVFDSGLPIRVVGLDVTHQALVTQDELERFRDLADPVGPMLYRLLSFYGRREATGAGFPIHDVLAVAALLEPDLFGWRSLSLSVGAGCASTRGATRPRSEGPTVDMAIDIDVERFFQWLWKALSVYDEP